MHALAGENAVSRGTASLDEEIRASLHRPRDCWSRVPSAVAFVSGALEIWFALRLFEHPVGIDAALVSRA